MDILLHPTYFPSIAQCVAMVQAQKVSFEVCDNYQKQTYRNRMNIYGAQGKMPLTVPVIYSQKNRQRYKDIRISNNENWQDLHWKSIQSAYSSSPFFEFYEHDLIHLFQEEATHLMAFNFKCLEVLLECLQHDLKYDNTTEFELNPQDKTDYRYLVDHRKETEQILKPYVQVFDDKHGFTPNLSVLDLIFNEGPNALLYLEQQHLPN
ncbi:WbqC family protein [Gelidibacter salicanalis]|uniref:WbqC family protein n=1 Tax=Gelidibacter salicanalis TaxID=291193 RepID=A0A934KPX2_9FLAO|nr:WbqC family protein [Gelidibacter salicanalis]MBJ7879296.1 WbqC family protein [Gelidibacter salicanalis]